MSGSVSASSTTTSTGSSEIDGAIAAMTAAFDKAIATNTEITTIKTEKGAVESAAQQRPNIG